MKEAVNFNHKQTLWQSGQWRRCSHQRSYSKSNPVITETDGDRSRLHDLLRNQPLRPTAPSTLSGTRNEYLQIGSALQLERSIVIPTVVTDVAYPPMGSTTQGRWAPWLHSTKEYVLCHL